MWGFDDVFAVTQLLVLFDSLANHGRAWLCLEWYWLDFEVRGFSGTI